MGGGREMNDRPTPDTDAAWQSDKDTVFRVETSRRIERERDEARAVAYDLATIASHCLGWHDHETAEAAERISSVLQKWKQIKSHDIT
jgi:hypothetical protein